MSESGWLPLSNGLRTEIARLVDDLVSGHSSRIATDGRAGRLTEEELREAISNFGRELVSLPVEGWALIDIVPHTADLDAASVDVPLWIREEGRSDLTLSLTAFRHGDRYRLEIDDLHVL